MPRILKNTPEAEKSRQAYARRRDADIARYEAAYRTRWNLRLAIRITLDVLTAQGYTADQIRAEQNAGIDLFGVLSLTSEQRQDYRCCWFEERAGGETQAQFVLRWSLALCCAQFYVNRRNALEAASAGFVTAMPEGEYSRAA